MFQESEKYIGFRYFGLLFVLILGILSTIASGGGGGGGGGGEPPDTTPPTVISVTPSAGQTDVGRNVTVTAIFSESMNGVTINASTFTLEDNIGTPVAGTVSYSGITATLTPAAPA